MDNSTALATLSCPLGGFLSVCYKSGQSQFIGCCDDDACGPAGCSDGNLRNTSFTPGLPIILQDQNCIDGLFWTCNFTSPPFWGCCKTNPCNNSSSPGCPAADLAAAVIKNEPGNPFIPPSQSRISTGAIVGVVLGVLAVLGLVTVVITLRLRRRKKVAQQNDTFINQKDPHQQTNSTKDSPFSPYIPSEPGSSTFPVGEFPSEDASMKFSVQSGYSGYTLGGSPAIPMEELPGHSIIFELPEAIAEE